MSYETGTTHGDAEVTFQQIADEIGVSRPQAQQIYHRAIRKLQSDSRLRAYWEDMLEQPRSLDLVSPE
jgi:DNA-directed RNA polymerase sigma subunit (sigma70/sigma32)